MKFELIRFSDRFEPRELMVTVVHSKPNNARALRSTGVAITQKDGTTHIGIAVCGPKDTFVKTTGRNIAYGRAIQAMLGNPTGFDTRYTPGFFTTDLVVERIKYQMAVQERKAIVRIEHRASIR
jgi:hypothetical protein